MGKERIITACLYGIAAVMLCGIVVYNLWIAPPAEGFAPVRLQSGTSESSVPLDLPNSPTPNAPLNLNTADAEELMTLPGIGEKLAARILDYRGAQGQFEDIAELLNIEGIGEKTFERLKPLLTIE